MKTESGIKIRARMLSCWWQDVLSRFDSRNLRGEYEDAVEREKSFYTILDPKEYGAWLEEKVVFYRKLGAVAAAAGAGLLLRLFFV